MYYAGIGSRETPIKLSGTIEQIVKYCEAGRIILRSGGADGADSIFEQYIKNPLMKEIYLPWKGFNGNNSHLYEPSDIALTIAERFHPAWDRLTTPVRQLMARNTHQVLGRDCETPSSFIICWTPEGKYTGGTSQAMRVADYYQIPIINLFNNSYDQVINKINKIVI